MKDDVLRSKLSEKLKESTDDVMVDVQVSSEENTETRSPLELAADNVMISYQNANKWLDTIKETLLMDHGCVFFSNYVHNLAHSMPVRFDKFGDILHTIDMKVSYPATQYIDKEPSSVQEAFDKITYILNDICGTLSAFISEAENQNMKAVAISTENLLSEVSLEFTNLKRMHRAYVSSGENLITFDKWVESYINNLGTLID